jgi:hypothetical protein
MTTRYLVQLVIEGKIVHTFVSEPNETVPEIRKRVRETMALTFTPYDEVTK